MSLARTSALTTSMRLSIYKDCSSSAAAGQRRFRNPLCCGSLGFSVAEKFRSRVAAQASGGSPSGMRVPTVIGEEPVYQRYLSVLNRKVKYPSEGSKPERVYEFDVVGHPKSEYHFTCIFPVTFADGKPKVTLINEYCWGPDAVLHSLPTGGFDPRKHASYEDCARAELSEEAHLKGGQLIRLLPEAHPGIAESKWCANRFTPFLAIGPESDGSPGEREGEEFIQIRRVGMDELQELMYSGYFSQPSLTTSMMAINRLKSMGMLP